MAIVKMKRVSLIAEKKDKKRILEELMWLSSVDITPLSERLEDEKWSVLFRKDSNDENGEKYRKAKDDIDKAISILNPYSTEKHSVFTKPGSISRKDFDEFEKNNRDIMYTAYSVLDIQTKLNEIKTRKNKNRSLMQALLPWQAYPFDLNAQISSHVDVDLETFPAVTDFEKETSLLYEAVPECYAELLKSDSEQYYVALLYLKSAESKLMSALSERGWTSAFFYDMCGRAEDNILFVREQLEQADEEEKALIDQLRVYAEKLQELEKASDIVANNEKLFSIRDRLLCTESTFFLDGWCPVPQLDSLNQVLEKFDCYFEINDPSEEEEPPILLQNNRFVMPFETVTKMYALPVYRGIDPDFIMAPFFFIFFGMMMGDAGYGFLLTLACAILLKFGNFGKNMKQNLKMFLFCGISTIIWGFLFGSFFGNVVTLFSGTFFDKTADFRAVWFNPMEAPLTLLILSFGIGFFHVIVGMCMKMFMLIRDKKYAAAFFDIGFWLLTLIGLVLFAVGSVVMSEYPLIGKIGMYAALIGAIGLVLTQGRDKKTPVAKLFGGIMSLYDITGYLSDVLSYSRILALGLSTSVIAMVFNYLAVLFGGGIVGAIVFVVVFALGTALNIALSTLSAYVHSSRLQFIEFFSKFYESGGREFDALRVETKYSRLK